VVSVLSDAVDAHEQVASVEELERHDEYALVAPLPV
jgi:hypothetical protein